MVWICSFIFDVFGQFRFESQNEERTERLFFNRCKNKSIVPKETSDNQQGFARRFSDVERLLKMTEIIFPPLQDRNYIRLGRPLYLEIAKNNNTFLTLWIVQVARDDCFHELYLHRISFFFIKTRISFMVVSCRRFWWPLIKISLHSENILRYIEFLNNREFRWYSYRCFRYETSLFLNVLPYFLRI